MVLDNDGLSSTASGEFHVLSAPPPPVAVSFAVADDPAAGSDGLRALQNIALYVNDPASALPDSQLAWDDDHGRSTVVSYAADGTYRVGLRAGDPAGSPRDRAPKPGRRPARHRWRRAAHAARPAPGLWQLGRIECACGLDPSDRPARLAMVPFGRRLLLAGPIVLTDGVPRGTRPAAGRTAPGLNLRRRTLILGRLFASRAARVQATATATARDTGGASAARTVTLGRTTLTLQANTSRALRLRVPASVILRVRGAKRLSVTTRLAVTEPGRKTVSAQRLARIAVVPR